MSVLCLARSEERERGRELQEMNRAHWIRGIDGFALANGLEKMAALPRCHDSATDRGLAVVWEWAAAGYPMGADGPL